MRAHEVVERSFAADHRRFAETERRISNSALEAGFRHPEADALQALRLQLEGSRDSAQREHWMQQLQQRQREQERQHYGHRQGDDGSVTRGDWVSSQSAAAARHGTALPPRSAGPMPQLDEDMPAQLLAASSRGPTVPRVAPGPARPVTADDAPPPSPPDSHQQQGRQLPPHWDAATANQFQRRLAPPPSAGDDGAYPISRGFAASLGRSASAGIAGSASYENLSQLDLLSLGLNAGGLGAAGDAVPETKRQRLEAPAPAQTAGDAAARLMQLLLQQRQMQQNQQQQQEQEERQQELERLQRLQQLERLERDERRQQEALLSAYISRLEPELAALLRSRLHGADGGADADADADGDAGSPLHLPSARLLQEELLRGQAGLALARSRSEGDDGPASFLMPALPPRGPAPFGALAPDLQLQPHAYGQTWAQAQPQQHMRQRHWTGGLHASAYAQYQRPDQRLQQPALSRRQIAEEPVQQPQLLEELRQLQQRLLHMSSPLPLHTAQQHSLELDAALDRHGGRDGGGGGGGDIRTASVKRRGSDDSVRVQQPTMHRSASAAAAAGSWAAQPTAGADDLLNRGRTAGNSVGDGSGNVGSGSGRLGLQLAAASAIALRNMPQEGSISDPAEVGGGIAAAGAVLAGPAAAATAAGAAGGGGGGASAAPAVGFLDQSAAAAFGDDDGSGLPRTRRCAVCRVKRKGRCGTSSAPPTCLGRELIDTAEEEAGEGAAVGSKRGGTAASGRRGRRRRGSAESDDDADYSYRGSARARSTSGSPHNQLGASPAAAFFGVAAAGCGDSGRNARLLSDPTGWVSAVVAGGSNRGGARSADAHAGGMADGLSLLARLANLADEAPGSPFAAASSVQTLQPKPDAGRQSVRELLAPAATAGARLQDLPPARGPHAADGFTVANLAAAEERRNPPGGSAEGAATGAAAAQPELPRSALQAFPELARMLAAAATGGPGSAQQSLLSDFPSAAAVTGAAGAGADADGSASGSGAGGSHLPRAASGQPSMTAGVAADVAAAADAAAAAAAAEAAAGADTAAELAAREHDAGRSVVRCVAPAHVAELQALLDSHAGAAALSEAATMTDADKGAQGQQQEAAAAGVLTIDVDFCGRAVTPHHAAAALDTQAAAEVVRVRRGQHLVLRNGCLRACVAVEAGATAQLERMELAAAPASGAAAAAAAAPAIVLVQGAGSRAVLRGCKVAMLTAASAAAAEPAPSVAAAAAGPEGGGGEENMSCCVLVRAGGCAVLQGCELTGAPNAGLSVEGPGSSAQATSTTARGCGLGFLASAGGVLEAVSGCAAVGNGMGFLAFTAPTSTEAAGAAAAIAAAQRADFSSPPEDSGGASATTSTSSDSGGSDRPAAAAATVAGPPAAQLLAGPRTAAAHNGAAGFGAVGCGSVLTAGAGCRSLGNHGCGFLAAQGGRLTVGDETLAEGNDSGFASSGAGSVLMAGARCEAVGAAGCGFLAEEGAELAAARGCVALGGAAHGFCARTGGRLVLSDGCQSECNAGRGFCDGSASVEGDTNGGGGSGGSAETAGGGGGGRRVGQGRGHLELGVGCVSLGNLEPCAAAAVAAGLLRAPGAADGNAADVRAARAVLAAAGVLGAPARVATATAGLFHNTDLL
ncbi:hypothetical protein HXX76_001296 [Chlamydomonas incerta]|uniref:Right handed beta helix domain-containing protein n=1 Tax=Chlamydomonas incerta TaxID=51695 RepID=A0A835WBW0_CHLIN|nr:hypothetical protein HXX76_001296 [Chlamydomonas incerta]|eukprot:KAG2444551.1 hypothetical protein HXX76_001296 [Chlamydomonas incerta]